MSEGSGSGARAAAGKTSSASSLVAMLPAGVRPWAEKGLAFVNGLSKPARVLAVSTLLAALVIGGYFGVHGSNVSYVVLFSNLEHDDAATVVAKLKEMKVPYRLEGDGSTIEVPEEKARETRLELAGAGLPRGGAVGFESFDKMRLGATEFEQRILYRRSLEGELSRTIGTIAAVQSARVHLVLPEKSVFVTKNEASSASVVLKLRSGRALGGGEVNGIVHLVSTSVAGLSPDRVAVVTTEGAVLHKPRRPGEDGANAGDDDRASQARSLEATLEERARTMVERVTGPGHVDVRITADIDSSRVERVEDHYDPKQTALRSEERNVEHTGGPDDVPVAGVPGAESNLPSGAAKGSAADGGAPTTTATTAGITRDSHTRNFEVDHITEKRILTGGVLRRLTVAVVVDGATQNGQPRSKEEVEKIASLVRSAVGVDEKRGDMVTVEAVPFLVEPPAPAAPPSLFTMPTEPKKLAPIAGGAALVVIVTMLLIARRIRKRRKEVSLALALAAEKEKQNAEEITVEILGTPSKKDKNGDDADALPSGDDLKRLVRERAAMDPATAALVVRGWLGSATDNKSDAAAPATSEVAA